MNSDHSIEKTVRLAAGNLHYMLQPFYPDLKTDSSDIAEQNMTFQFAHAFLSWNLQGGAFFEIPFRQNADPVRRFDFYLHNLEFGIVGETKMLTRQKYEAKKFDEMWDDKQKMSRANIEKMLATCVNKDAAVPPKIFRLLLAGAWEEDIVEWWVKGNVTVNKLSNRSELLDGMYADAVPVIRYPLDARHSKMETLYLLYAYDLIIAL